MLIFLTIVSIHACTLILYSAKDVGLNEWAANGATSTRYSALLLGLLWVGVYTHESQNIGVTVVTFRSGISGWQWRFSGRLDVVRRLRNDVGHLLTIAYVISLLNSVTRYASKGFISVMLKKQWYLYGDCLHKCTDVWCCTNSVIGKHINKSPWVTYTSLKRASS